MTYILDLLSVRGYPRVTQEHAASDEHRWYSAPARAGDQAGKKGRTTCARHARRCFLEKRPMVKVP